MSLPAIIFLGLVIFCIIYAYNIDGEIYEFSFLRYCIGAAITLSLLTWGGFFSIP